MGLDTGSPADLNRLLQDEWRESNAAGDYAASTVSGINTRRQHGLFVAGPTAGDGPRLLCAKMDESVMLASRRYELGANEYQGAIAPQGYRYLTRFTTSPWPTWTYTVESARLEKQVLLPHDRRVCLVGYRLLNHDALVSLELRPLLAGRGSDSLMLENWHFRRQASVHDRRLEMVPYDDRSRIVLYHPQASFGGDGYWFYNFIYRADEPREPHDLEDLFSPGVFTATLRPGVTHWTVIAPDDPGEIDPEAVAQAERARREAAGAEA